MTHETARGGEVVTAALDSRQNQSMEAKQEIPASMSVVLKDKAFTPWSRA